MKVVTAMKGNPTTNLAGQIQKLVDMLGKQFVARPCNLQRSREEQAAEADRNPFTQFCCKTNLPWNGSSRNPSKP